MKHINRYRYFLISMMTVMIVAACKTPKVAPTVLPEKTAFYTIEATRDTVKQLTTFRVLKATIVDTRINYHADEAKVKSRDYLKIVIVTKHSAPVVAYSEHPLFKKLDLYEESGEISSKLISLPKGQVTVRVPCNEEYSTITITETINFNPAKPVTLKHEK